MIGTAAELALRDRIQRMLSRFEYLLPLAAADFQYRRHYYRLNAAALLEDLFFDSLGTFLRQTEPHVNFGRAPSGTRAWDYEVDGLKVSHKMSKGGTEISVHWDATKKESVWTAQHPLVVGLSDHLPKAISAETSSGTTIRCYAVVLDEPRKETRAVLVGAWRRESNSLFFQVFDSIEVQAGVALTEAVPFDLAWTHMAHHLHNGGNANDFDLLICPATKASGIQGSTLSVDHDHQLPGFHIFAKSSMKDLPLKSNNRSGSLLSKELVRRLMAESQSAGLFAPLPLWFSIYAEKRPPNLYATQRQELDGIFSARLE